MQFVLLQLPQQSKKLVYTYAWLVCNLLKLYCALCLQSVGFAYQYIVLQQARLGRAGLERLPTGLAWAAFRLLKASLTRGLPSMPLTYVSTMNGNLYLLSQNFHVRHFCFLNQSKFQNTLYSFQIKNFEFLPQIFTSLIFCCFLNQGKFNSNKSQFYFQYLTLSTAIKNFFWHI